MRMVRGLYVSPDCVQVCEVDDDLGCDGYYELLGCETVDAPEAWFRMTDPGDVTPEAAGAYFDIICDDEALCRAAIPACTVAKVGKDGYAIPWIHGPCFVCKANEDGEWVSCTDDELKWLKSAVRTYKGDFILTTPAERTP